jgi:hypothetical protein
MSESVDIGLTYTRVAVWLLTDQEREQQKNPPKWGWEGISAAYLVPGVQADGTEQILGLWIEQTK